ncbi:MAG: DUF2478 domain-containing protein [Rhodobacteraceae bacterium]|nr:DUF2478 domain-containing protein [Paracoccaceae bacterium]
MKIAYVSSEVRGETDRLLSEIAGLLRSNGRSLSGIVKEMDYASSFENGCDMKVRVLPEGPTIQITQDLGQGSDACRLDPGAIANAVSCVESRGMSKAELFILNKFGPEEAAGRGFVSAIGTAIENGVPVLVGLGGANTAAFKAFSEGLAEELPSDGDAILNWCEAAMLAAPNDFPA